MVQKSRLTSHKGPLIMKPNTLHHQQDHFLPDVRNWSCWCSHSLSHLDLKLNALLSNQNFCEATKPDFRVRDVGYMKDAPKLSNHTTEITTVQNRSTIHLLKEVITSDMGKTDDTWCFHFCPYYNKAAIFQLLLLLNKYSSCPQNDVASMLTCNFSSLTALN